jgi:ribonuclease HI
MTKEAKSVTIYTDGACLGNPGPGGYAAILLHGGHRKELSGGYRLTTNNRMEIMAAIVGLQALKQRCAVKLHTDSKYLQQSISLGWAQRWRAKGWKKGDGKRRNWDLWDRLLDLCAKHKVELIWLRGHAGDTENERCDFLSVEAAQKKDLPADTFFEQLPVLPEQTAPPSLFDLPAA